MTTLEIVAIICIAIVLLLVYLIATHKIDLQKLKGELLAELSSLSAKADATHAAALAPVVVANAPQSPPPPNSQTVTTVTTAPPTAGVPISVQPAVAALPATSTSGIAYTNPMLDAYRQSNTPAPTQTTPPPSSPPPAVVEDGTDFPWVAVGKVIDYFFYAGKAESFTTRVPAPTSLTGQVLDSSFDPKIDSAQIRIWFTDEAGNEIAGSVYEGSFIQGTMQTPTFAAPQGLARFNVLVKDKSGHLRMKLNHA